MIILSTIGGLLLIFAQRNESKRMNHLKFLRLLALIEGISYLLLVGICMPLKYIWNIPEPTHPIGLAHGVLFVTYCVWVLIVTLQKKWSFGTMMLAGIASLLPFGTFVADKKIFAQEEQD